MRPGPEVLGPPAEPTAKAQCLAAALPRREGQDDFAAMARAQAVAVVHLDADDVLAVPVAELAFVGLLGALPFVERKVAREPHVQTLVADNGRDSQRIFSVDHLDGPLDGRVDTALRVVGASVLARLRDLQTA